MKKTDKISKLYRLFTAIIFASLACIIAALVLCDYSFDRPFAEIWTDNSTAFILAGVSVALDLVLAISAIVLKVKNDEKNKDDVAVAFQISIILLLETVLCVPIFIVWLVERIHDAVSYRRNEKI